MKKTYSKEELCEQILNVAVSSFDRHKKHYVALLEESFIVEVIKGARGKLFYDLTPKAPTMYVNLKSKEAEKVDLILKALVIERVIPVLDEIEMATGLSNSTLKRTIRLMKKENIILEPEYEPRYILDENTGEVLHKWLQKKVSYTYYDLVDGKREKLEYPTIHENYGKFFGKKLNKLQFELGKHFNMKIGLEVAGFHAFKELTKYYGVFNIKRQDNFIINKVCSKAIKEKYGRK